MISYLGYNFTKIGFNGNQIHLIFVIFYDKKVEMNQYTLCVFQAQLDPRSSQSVQDKTKDKTWNIEEGKTVFWASVANLSPNYDVVLTDKFCLQ